MSSGMPNSWAMASRWSTPLVDPPVAATLAMALSSAVRVTNADGRASRRTRSITSSPDLAGRLVLGRVLGRDAVETGRRQPDELEDRGHRVGRVLPAARAGAGARDVLDLVQLVERDLARPIRADGLVDGDDRRVALALVRARVDRPVVEDEARDIEPAQGHRGARDRLVTADEADQAVEQVAADDQLDRVGDDLAADERRLHAFGAHRHAVAHRHRVELHRRAARRADAGLDATRRAGAGCSCTASSRSTSSRRRRAACARSSSVNPIALSIARAPARSGPSVSAAEWRLAGSVGRSYGCAGASVVTGSAMAAV